MHVDSFDCLCLNSEVSGDESELKSACSSCREPEFGPSTLLVSPMTPAPGHSLLASVVTPRHTHMCAHTQRMKVKLGKNSQDKLCLIEWW